MAQSNDAWTELIGLRDEIANLVHAKADELHAASRAHADTVVEQMKGVLHDVGETLRQDERHLEDIVATRPLPALAIAFALGVVIGISLRAAR
jgi:ElaB/YqjD/DUF883 family membrane-anchored ribosome-binding protein